MGDTIRTLAQLLAQYAENKSGQITAQDGRDLIISMAQILKESGGTEMTLGPVADGDVMVRSGATMAGVASIPPKIISTEDIDNSSFSGVAFVQKLRLSFVAEAADYLLFFYSEIRSSNSATKVKARFQEDDSTPNLAEIAVLPDPVLLTGYGPFDGFVRVALTEGAHTFDIDFGSSQAGKVVDIRRARAFALKIQ